MRRSQVRFLSAPPSKTGTAPDPHRSLTVDNIVIYGEATARLGCGHGDKRANTLHRHPKMEEFCFVVEGVGRIRIGDQTLTFPKHGGVLVGPAQLRQLFNDTETEVLWLIIGAPEKEFESGETLDPKLFYPVDLKQLPKEMEGVAWPTQS
jgi:mannose-6-phosphate isomerase-like protein (cupin superfamily)